MTYRNSSLVLKLVIVVLVTLALGMPLGRWSRAVPDIAAQEGRQGMQGMQMPMQDMMKIHEKMMAEMKTSQARLDDLAKKMNSATGNAKVDAMAEVLNELVRQHRAMGEHMGSMHQQMMGQTK
jgi:hypothetical protein